MPQLPKSRGPTVGGGNPYRQSSGRARVEKGVGGTPCLGCWGRLGKKKAVQDSSFDGREEGLHLIRLFHETGSVWVRDVRAGLRGLFWKLCARGGVGGKRTEHPNEQRVLKVQQGNPGWEKKKTGAEGGFLISLWGKGKKTEGGKKKEILEKMKKR